MAEVLSDLFGLSERAIENLLVSLVAIVVVLGIRFVVVRVVHRRVEDPTVWYHTRRIASYVAFAVLALILGRIWLRGFDALVTYLGLVSAGVAIALSELLKNLAGFLFITTRRPFKVGDRVEIGDHAGDVVDIRAFRFSLLEIRNWVSADQSTGRILHVPNGKIFTETLANFGAGFHWIWHEIPVLITFESDWERGQEVLRGILEQEAPRITTEEARRSLQRAAREYLVNYTHLTPTVYVEVRDSGVLLTGRALCDIRERRGLTHRVWSALLRAFAADPALELAYPTVRTYFEGPVRIRQAEERTAGQDDPGTNSGDGPTPPPGVGPGADRPVPRP